MKKRFRIIIWLVVLLTAATLTPLLMSDDYRPTLWGFPYTLWMGFLFSAVYTLLIGLGIQSIKEKKEENL